MHAQLPHKATDSTPRPVWADYALALGCAAVAFAAHWGLRPWLAPTPFLLLLAGVLVAARVGGRGPAWLATVVSALLAQGFPADAAGTPALETVLFVAVGGLVAVVGRPRASATQTIQGGPVWLKVGGTPALAPRRRSPEECLATDASGGELAPALLDASDRRRLELECAELLEREHAALREAQAHRARMESLFQQASVAIGVFQGPEHRCELLNPHALALIDPEGAVTGRPLADLLPDINPGLLRLLDDVFHSGVPFSGRQVPLILSPARNAAGLGRYFDVTWQPWRGADGAIQGVMAVAVEVTGLVNARRAAEALTQELQQVLQTRDEFLSVASHELKTPITSLQLQLDMLLRSATHGESGPALQALVRKRVEATLRPVARLQQLVATLLDVSRIRAGRLDLQHEAVDLAALVQEVATRAQEDAALARCPLHVAVDGPLEGHWDRMRLEQVITNLLSNAFKYGAQRPVEVCVTREEGHARLTVTDHGIGIASEDHERIFQRYERAVSERHYGGFGLGLWIVRQILESLRGDIHVESQQGQGATFIVRLPLSPVASAVG